MSYSIYGYSPDFGHMVQDNSYGRLWIIYYESGSSAWFVENYDYQETVIIS